MERAGSKEAVYEEIMLLLGFERMVRILPARQVGGKTSGHWDLLYKGGGVQPSQIPSITASSLVLLWGK